MIVETVEIVGIEEMTIEGEIEIVEIVEIIGTIGIEMIERGLGVLVEIEVEKVEIKKEEMKAVREIVGMIERTGIETVTEGIRTIGIVRTIEIEMIGEGETMIGIKIEEGESSAKIQLFRISPSRFSAC